MGYAAQHNKNGVHLEPWACCLSGLKEIPPSPAILNYTKFSLSRAFTQVSASAWITPLFRLLLADSSLPLETQSG